LTKFAPNGEVAHLKFDRKRPTKLAQSSAKKLRLKFNEHPQIAKFCTKVGVNDYKSGYLIFTFAILCHFDKKLRVLGAYQKRNEKYRSFLGCKLSF